MGYFGIPFRNGVPIGLGSVASFGAQQFDPSSLFIGGTAGTFYDPSDPTTLFTTSTGTTPCAVPGSGSQVLVGLMLDKSQGAPGALGAELVTNGDFPVNTTGWTAVNSPTLSVGANGVTIQNNGGTNGLIYQAITTVAGRMYKIEGTITYGGGFARIETSTTIPVTVGGGNINVNASGRYTWYFTAVASITYLVIGNRNDVNAANTYDNISVREIPGNHAIAFNDTTARPELSARVNLLTYSEDWTNAVWQKLQSGTGVAPVVTNNFATAPDGTQTATRVQFNLGATPATAVSRLFQNAADNVTVARTKTVWAKTNDNSTKNIYIQGPQSGNTLLTVTPAWTLFTISDTSTTVSAYSQMQLGLDGSQGTSTTADILFWHPDIRQTNIGSAIPSYQRIADQYTYDSNGFPSYLRFDGVDDSMYTPASINFSGTDKMSVFAGVRKLSDAAASVIVGNGADFATAGAWEFQANTGANATTAFRGRSSSGSTAQAGFTRDVIAPDTFVFASLVDYGAAAGAEFSGRYNGIVQAQNIGLTEQNTGNFGSNPLTIAARQGGASLRFNGHLYSLIIAGSAVSAGNISATEQWVAQRTGIVIP